MKYLKIQSLLEGALTFLPGCANYLSRGTGGTHKARYCYSVWLRHLVMTSAYRNHHLSGRILELGPGDSLGTGLAALISGYSVYFALDEVPFASNSEKNINIFNELLSLFSNHEAIPDAIEFPAIKPSLSDYSFPDNLLPDQLRSDQKKIDAITSALTELNKPNGPITYVSPSNAARTIQQNSLDMIFSQAVLEHVDKLLELYENCFLWLKPGGLMSHQIDFKSHGVSKEWNGHWTYSPLIWHLIRGRRPYLINRLPCSIHLKLLKEIGFEVLHMTTHCQDNKITRNQLAHDFTELTEDDLTTAGLYYIARKPL